MQTAEICGNENYLKLLKKKLLFTFTFSPTETKTSGEKSALPDRLLSGLFYATFTTLISRKICHFTG